MHEVNGIIVVAAAIVIGLGIRAFWDWADRRDRRKVAEAIKNGTLWGPTSLPQQRQYQPLRRIDRW